MPRLQFIPGPDDRLNVIERLARATLNDLKAIVAFWPGPAAQPEPQLLDENQVYVSEIELPRASWSRHEKALQMQLEQLSPIPTASAAIAVRAVNSETALRSRYQIAIARNAELESFDGGRVFVPANAPHLSLRANSQYARERKTLLIMALGSVLAAAALIVTPNTLARQLESNTLIASQALREERAALISSQNRTETLEGWHTLTTTHTTARETDWPQLADISASLPDGLAAQTIELADGELVLHWKSEPSPQQLADLESALGPQWSTTTDGVERNTRVVRR